MKLLSRVAIAALFFGIFPLQMVPTSAAQPRPQVADAPLQVCVDQKTNEPLAGDIELMLVMDNSLSLKTNDPEGKRFSQVRTMLRSVHDRISKSRKPRDVRFSLITFADRAIAKIPIAKAVVLSANNLDEVGNDVESAAPGDQFNTDYVLALEMALEQMKDAPAQNCRVIVWFTDGAYWPSGGAKNSTEGGNLREAVCKSGGFSESLRSLNINIFPLYIEPKNPNDKEDPTASRDVMAHLTGDQNAFGKNPYSPGAPCGTQQTHVGEVLSASNVNQLGQFFVDLPNIIDGGVPVACPTKEGKVESTPLPAGRYVAEISIVKYAATGKELSPSDLVARQPDGSEQSLDDYYSGENGRYEATDKSLELKSGWIIKGSGEEHCIRAFAREGLAVQIRKLGNTAELVEFGSSKKWLAGEDLVSSKEDSDVPKVRLGDKASCKTLEGFTTDASGLEKAFEKLSDRGKGIICVDPPDSQVFPDGVNINVAREGQPLIDCDAITIRRSGAKEYVRGDRTEKSTTCKIDFSGSGTKFEGVVTSFDELFGSDEVKECNVDTQKSVINADSKDEVVSLSLTMILRENLATKCNISDREVIFSYQDPNGMSQTGKIETSIVLDLQPEPNRLLALIATLVTITALLALALALLRRMTVRAAAMTPAGKLLAVRFSAQASRSVDGRVSLTVENRLLRDVRLNMERVERARVEGSDSKLVFEDQSDEIVIIRELPPLRLMLREPWARVDDVRPYVVHPMGRHAPANQNLTAPFREAIVALDEGLVKGTKNERLISIWVIQNKGASGGDQVAIEENLKENGQALIEELLNHVKNDDEGETGSKAQELPGGSPPSMGGDSTSDSGAIPPPPAWD